MSDPLHAADPARRAPRLFWAWARGSGRPTSVQVDGFLKGRDVLRIDLDPAAFRGPVVVRARPADNRRDGLVTVNGQPLVIVSGVITLTEADLRVSRRGIPAVARHLAAQRDHGYGLADATAVTRVASRDTGASSHGTGPTSRPR